MAIVTNVHLTLHKHDHNNQTADIEVTFKVHFQPVERMMDQLGWTVFAELIGIDPTSQQILHEFSPRDFFRPGQVQTVDRSVRAVIADDILDEDPGLAITLDQIRARVRVAPRLPIGSGFRISDNEILHEFFT